MQWYDIALSCILTTAVVVQLVILIPQVKKQKALLEFVDTFIKATDLSRLEKYGELMEKQAEAKSVVTIVDLQAKLDQETNMKSTVEQRFLEVSKALIDHYLFSYEPMMRLQAVKEKLPLSKDFILSALKPHHSTPSIATMKMMEKFSERYNDALHPKNNDTVRLKKEIYENFIIPDMWKLDAPPPFDEAKKKLGL
jgi:hypothetical protein